MFLGTMYSDTFHVSLPVFHKAPVPVLHQLLCLESLTERRAKSSRNKHFSPPLVLRHEHLGKQELSRTASPIQLAIQCSNSHNHNDLQKMDNC